MAGYDRRLPVYLLLDCSESMAGDAFEAVKSGLKTMITELRTNPMALETVALSVITFASSARQVMPLTDIITFQMPRFVMGSGTALGAALNMVSGCMDREIVKNTPQCKGDYRPFCFIFTDGEPTDDWKAAADRFKTKYGSKATVVAVACGQDADVDKLKYITENVVVLKDDSTKALTAFFKWVSASVSTASRKVESPEEGGLNLARMDGSYMEFAGEMAFKKPLSDRYVFLHAKCIKNKKFYIMRYRKAEEAGYSRRGSSVYQAAASHPVEDFELDPEGFGEELKVSTDLLQGDISCPYCGNSVWAMCNCGRIFCIPGTGKHTCPWCGETNTYEFASFDVGKGRG